MLAVRKLHAPVAKADAAVNRLGRVPGQSDDLPPKLSAATRQHLDEFGDLVALLLLVATGDRVLDAMAYVVLQNRFFDPAQRCLDSGNLGDHINAVSIFIDHL